MEFFRPSISAAVVIALLRASLATCEAGTPPLPTVGSANASATPGSAFAANAAVESRADVAEEEISSLLGMGQKLTDKGDFESAEIAFRQVMNNPTAADADVRAALAGLAAMHRKQGAFTKAAAIYEKFLKEHPGDPRTSEMLLDLGRTLRSLGAYKMATARFYGVINSAIKLSGDEFQHYQLLAKTAQFEIAETHFQAGDFAAANKYYTRLRMLELAPEDRARAHFKAGYSLRLQGQLDPAATTLRSFIEQYPRDENAPEARYLLATTLRDLGRHDEALAETLGLLQSEHARISTDRARWTYWQRKTGNQLANEFFDNGNTAHAQAIYSALLELCTDAVQRLPLTYQLGLCQERLGSLDAAKAAYQTVIDGAGKSGSAEFSELARMAAWRIDHMVWTDNINHQFSATFDTTTGKPASGQTGSGPASGP